MDAMEAADKAAVMSKAAPSSSSLSVTVDSHPPPPSSPPAVLMVCFWAFTNALVSAGFSAALTSGIPCMQLVHLVQLWHGAFQALAAAAALLSDRRGVRWVLAMVALAATAANHYMKLRGALAATAVNHCVFVRVVSLLLVAAPGSLLLRFAYNFVFLNAVAVDMCGFLALLLEGRRGLATS